MGMRVRWKWLGVRIRSSHYDDVPAQSQSICLTVHDPSYQRLSSAGDKMAFIVDKIVALWPWKLQVIMSQFVRGEKKTWGGDFLVNRLALTTAGFCLFCFGSFTNPESSFRLLEW